MSCSTFLLQDGRSGRLARLAKLTVLIAPAKPEIVLVKRLLNSLEPGLCAYSANVNSDCMESTLYTTSEALIAGVLLLLLLAATEAGFHFGRRDKARIDEKTKSQISVISGAVLGILGLLLGFTISMAVSRFDTRKQLVLDEANAIGTAYLRTSLLPEPDRTYIAGRLRDYLDLRLEYSRAGDDATTLKNANAVKMAREQFARVQNDLWTRAVSRAQQNPNLVTTGLVLQSLNQVIDSDAARWMAFNNHVPETVVYINIFIALLAITLIGYSFGLAGQRNLLSVCLLAIAVTATLLVIIDLDRSRQGLITVSQQPLIDLQRQLSNP